MLPLPVVVATASLSTDFVSHAGSGILLMVLQIASWNINSIRARAHLVHDWLERHPDCDLLALQEIKCEKEQFPPSFAEAGFHVAITGQKSYNGVAFISRREFAVHCEALPGFTDPAARYIEAEIEDVRVGNLYLPNGNSGGEEGFATKLAFFEALYQRAADLLAQGRDFVFIGDYNICPDETDYAPGTLAPDDALLRPESRASFRRLLWLGLTDALRVIHPVGAYYTFYDYQGGAFQRDKGLRIDHALLSPALADRLENFTIDREERAKEKPSDHLPVMVTLRQISYPNAPLED